MQTTAGDAAARPQGTLIPPDDGVIVRMYRIGHGDCFLLAFPGESKPFYVLIDCGYKPGSPKFVDKKEITAKEVGASIREATGGHIDVAVITHEHQDHVNGITEANFKGITIGETWFAWTENPEDELAIELREKFKKRLALLLKARNQLAADAHAADKISHIDDFLAFEVGGDDQDDFTLAAAENLLRADGGPENSPNKRAMKLFKTLSGNRLHYLQPHVNAIVLDGAKGVRVYALGPPRNPVLLHSLDPKGEESFRDPALAVAFGAAPANRYFAAAVAALGTSANRDPPFALRYGTGWEDAVTAERPHDFWVNFYGGDNVAPHPPLEQKHGQREAEMNPPWRRIDHDWLYSSEQFALDMNNDTNNGSLVLAFELPNRHLRTPAGKVLLFAADAQRGNWRSWTDGEWRDGERSVTAKDLLARTVLYKVGHHGSHNATLHGDSKSDYANLDWMAEGEAAGEFTAMITAVREWAERQKGWDHPQKAIKDALLHKAAGRVFQTDTDVDKMKPLGSQADWQRFLKRIKPERLFIDYTINL